MPKKNRRIFIGPHEIAGYYRNLTAGMKSIGVDCDYITFSSHPMGYGGENKTPFFLKLAKWFNGFRGTPNRRFLSRAIIAIPGEFFTFIWGLTAIIKYDVFIFGFGHSLFRNNLDLPLIRFLGKKAIINMAHGSELRPPYICGAYQSHDGTVQPNSVVLHESGLHLIRRIRFLERYASYIIGAPFSSTQFSNRRLINHFAMGLPCIFSDPASIGKWGKNNGKIEKDNDADRVVSNPGEPTRILHSPSHPVAKGSAVISQAIHNLIYKGHQIEFVQLQNRPNIEVLEEIQRCDFVVDQVFSDTPLAGFATEAAWFGKPAVVGGYGLKHLKQFIPDGMMPPSQICHPDDIESAVEELIINVELRNKLGRQAQEFVRSKWHAQKVAECYLRIIEDDIPDEWWLDPESVIYVHGSGLSEAQIIQNIRALVSTYGRDALHLSHRSELESAFLELAGVKI